MDKEEREYRDNYGDIPSNLSGRIDILTRGNNSHIRGHIIDEVKRVMGIKWETIRIVVWLVPKPTPRPRYSSSSHTFYVKGAANNHKRFVKFLEKENLNLIETPCTFKVVSFLPTPASMNKLEKIMAELGLVAPISTPDWDNLGKTYSDMVQNALILNDALIFKGESHKYYSIKPRVEIEISYMTDFDSNYNKRKINNMKKGMN